MLQIVEKFILPIILALIGAGFMTDFVKRRDMKNKDKFKEEVKGVITEVITPIYNELKRDSYRTRLYMQIRDNPTNHDTIINLAYKYFIKFKGDGEMFDMYRKWEKKQGIETEWFDIVLQKESKKKEFE